MAIAHRSAQASSSQALKTCVFGGSQSLLNGSKGQEERGARDFTRCALFLKSVKARGGRRKSWRRCFQPIISMGLPHLDQTGGGKNIVTTRNVIASPPLPPNSMLMSMRRRPQVSSKFCIRLQGADQHCQLGSGVREHFETLSQYFYRQPYIHT